MGQKLIGFFNFPTYLGSAREFYGCIKIRVEGLIFKVKWMQIEMNVDNIRCMLGVPWIVSSSDIFKYYVSFK